MSTFISPNSIEELLCKIDITSVISTYVKLKKEGANLKACCPFHQEKTPSFIVFTSSQRYHCFGCQENGNAINFIKKITNSNFTDAVKKLASQFGVQLSYKNEFNRDEPNPNKKYYDILETVMQLYHQQLKISKAHNARDYVTKRLLSQNVVDQFVLGYAPNDWHFIRSSPEIASFKQQDLIEVGLLVDNEEKKIVYDRFRNRLIFPIRNVAGRCIGFGARCLADSKIKYINSPLSPVFSKGKELYGLYEAKQANPHLKKLLIVEGYTDVISLHKHGINYAVATLGTAATTEHLSKAFTYVSEIIFCFDGDAAGHKASIKVLETALPIMQDGRQIKFVKLPSGEDPDSFICKRGKDNFLTYLNSNLASIDQFLFSVSSNNLDLNSLDDKAKFISLIKSYTNKLPFSAFKSLILNKLSQFTGINIQKNDIFKKKVTNNSTNANFYSQTINRYNSSTKKINIKISLCGYIIKYLLHDPSLVEHIDISIDNLLYYNGQDSYLLLQLLKLLRANPKMTPCGLIGYWYNTEYSKYILDLAEQDCKNLEGIKELKAILARIKRNIKQKQHKKQFLTAKVEPVDKQCNGEDLNFKTAYRKAFTELRQLKLKK
jgi:DNA primase